MTKPLLSVITPSYNYAHYLTATVESVAAARQDMPVEHVVVDDGSSDGSWQLLQRLSDVHPLVAARHSHRGLSGTLNHSLDLATGDWIVWLNADDLHLPWAYRLLRNALDLYPSADLIFGDTLLVDERDEIVRLVAQPQADRRVFEGAYNMFHNCSVFWRRQLLPVGWRFDERMQLLMDLDLWLTLCGRAGSIVKIDAPLSAFRQHPKQVSAASRDSDIAEIHWIGQTHGLRSLLRFRHARASWSSALRHAALKRLGSETRREREARALHGVNVYSVDCSSAGAERPVMRESLVSGVYSLNR